MFCGRTTELWGGQQSSLGTSLSCPWLQTQEPLLNLLLCCKHHFLTYLWVSKFP